MTSTVNANFSDVASKVNPVQGMSIADMLTMARNAQAYQQAQQLNPLQVEKAQTELATSKIESEKAKRTLEPTVSKAETESLLSKTSLNDAQLLNLQKQQANSSRNLIKLLDSPDPITPDVIKNHVVATMQNAGASDEAIIQAVQGLPTSGTDKQLRAYLAKHTLNSLTAEAELEKRFPNATMVSAGGNITPRQMGNEAFTGMKAGTAVGPSIAITPSPGTTTVNGVVGQYDTNGKFVPFDIQPSGTNTTPNVMPNVAPQGTTQKPSTSKTSLVQFDEPTSRGQLNEQEKTRYATGEEDYKASGERAQIAQDAKLAARQIKRSLAASSGSKAGQVVRDAGQMFFGNTELDTLVKNLAEQQVRQSALMGLKSVAAEQDLKTANGTDKVTNEALAHIVERAEATNLAAEKYNAASAKLQDKFGKTKAFLNTDNFKKAWSQNYDPVAFIIQNTNQQNIPQKDKDTIIDYYTSGMSQSQLDQLATKMKNLKRLERGDF